MRALLLAAAVLLSPGPYWPPDRAQRCSYCGEYDREYDDLCEGCWLHKVPPKVVE